MANAISFPFHPPHSSFSVCILCMCTCASQRLVMSKAVPLDKLCRLGTTRYSKLRKDATVPKMRYMHECTFKVLLFSTGLNYAVQKLTIFFSQEDAWTSVNIGHVLFLMLWAKCAQFILACVCVGVSMVCMRDSQREILDCAGEARLCMNPVL